MGIIVLSTRANISQLKFYIIHSNIYYQPAFQKHFPFSLLRSKHSWPAFIKADIVYPPAGNFVKASAACGRSWLAVVCARHAWVWVDTGDWRWVSRLPRDRGRHHLRSCARHPHTEPLHIHTSHSLYYRYMIYILIENRYSIHKQINTLSVLMRRISVISLCCVIQIGVIGDSVSIL